MARKTGQIIRCGSSTWLVRLYDGRDPETRKRKYIGNSFMGIHPGPPQPHACRAGNASKRNLQNQTGVINARTQSCTKVFTLTPSSYY